MAPPLQRFPRAQRASSSAAMPGVSIFNVDPTLFEKVVAKLQFKAYFRLQRTCRDAIERIRKCRHTSIHLQAGYHLYFKKSIVYFLRYVEGGIKELHHFYGTRVRKITLDHDDISVQFELLCDSLRNNGITCGKFNTGETKMTTEQCVTLMNILKPVKVTINSCDSNVYEALFQSNILKKVHIFLDEDVLAPVVTRMLPKFQKVTMHTFLAPTSDGPRYDLLRTIQQLFYSTPYPSLRQFSFEISWRGSELPSKAQIEAQFPDCRLTQEGGYKKYFYGTFVDLPGHFPPESSFKLALEHYAFAYVKVVIAYKAEEVDF